MIYQPAEDSELLARNLKRYVTKKSFLDMGAGSGIQSETALKAGAARIVLSDIDPCVVLFLKKKFSNYPSIKIVSSNVFSRIKETFDVIAFNPPYLPHDPREDTNMRRVTTGGMRGDEITLRFVKGLSRHLSPKGVALVVVSSLTPRDKILQAVQKARLKKKVIDSASFFMERLEVWELTRKAQ